MSVLIIGQSLVKLEEVYPIGMGSFSTVFKVSIDGNMYALAINLDKNDYESGIVNEQVVKSRIIDTNKSPHVNTYTDLVEVADLRQLGLSDPEQIDKWYYVQQNLLFTYQSKFRTQVFVNRYYLKLTNFAEGDLYTFGWKMAVVNSNILYFGSVRTTLLRGLKVPVGNNWLHIIFQLMHGLYSLHKSGISHWDLKPDNLLVFFYDYIKGGRGSENHIRTIYNLPLGGVRYNVREMVYDFTNTTVDKKRGTKQSSMKLIDFGFAHIEKNGERMVYNMSYGTRGYLSPELLFSGLIDMYKTDVFSMGIMIIDILNTVLIGADAMKISQLQVYTTRSYLATGGNEMLADIQPELIMMDEYVNDASQLMNYIFTTQTEVTKDPTVDVIDADIFSNFNYRDLFFRLKETLKTDFLTIANTAFTIVSCGIDFDLDRSNGVLRDTPSMMLDPVGRRYNAVLKLLHNDTTGKIPDFVRNFVREFVRKYNSTNGTNVERFWYTIQKKFLRDPLSTMSTISKSLDLSKEQYIDMWIRFLRERIFHFNPNSRSSMEEILSSERQIKTLLAPIFIDPPKGKTTAKTEIFTIQSKMITSEPSSMKSDYYIDDNGERVYVEVSNNNNNNNNNFESKRFAQVKEQQKSESSADYMMLSDTLTCGRKEIVFKRVSGGAKWMYFDKKTKSTCIGNHIHDRSILEHYLQYEKKQGMSLCPECEKRSKRF
jgi:serine/threonine protein kinase